MSKAIEVLQAAMKRAIEIRPKVGGYPYLAETLRRAGVTRNLWYLPACQSVYLTELGPVVQLGTPLVSGMADVPKFDREALIVALMACWCCSLRCRFRRTHMHLLRRTERRVRRKLSSDERAVAARPCF